PVPEAMTVEVLVEPAAVTDTAGRRRAAGGLELRASGFGPPHPRSSQPAAPMGIEEALQYEIPYLHPLAQHFPLVLLMLAAGAATAYAVLGTAVWRRTVLALLVLAVPAAYWAHRTGEALEDAVEGEPSVERFVEYHEAAATWTLRAGVVALLA